MTSATDNFWGIIDRVGAISGGDLGLAIAAFRAELEALDDEELVAVASEFFTAMRRAYDWNLWAAAYVIHGGCSDDAFWDFRAGLVALGRDVFEAALADPDSLAAIEDIEDRTLFEGFQYVPNTVLEERGIAAQTEGRSVDGPTGQSWSEDDTDTLKARFPRLAQRFDWI